MDIAPIKTQRDYRSALSRRQSLRYRTQRRTETLQWTADPDKIIQAVRRGHQVLDSIH